MAMNGPGDAMEHWAAAVAASIIGIVMAALVVMVSFKVAGPGPAYTFTNRSSVHSPVAAVAVH